MAQSYEKYVSIIANQPNLTLASVVSSLIMEETKMEANLSLSTSTPHEAGEQPFLMDQRKKKPKNLRSCYYRTKKGHVIKDCFKWKKDK